MRVVAVEELALGDLAEDFANLAEVATVGSRDPRLCWNDAAGLGSAAQQVEHSPGVTLQETYMRTGLR
jgi:hypothetical protein